MLKTKWKKFLSFLMICVLVVSPLFGVTLTASAAPSISLVTVSHFNFNAATEGYGAQAPYSVLVKNDSTEDTGKLTVALSGSNPTAFTLSNNSISNILAGKSDSILVYPATGLAAGSYTATVTISGSNVNAQSFDVSFSVSPAGATYTVQIRTYIDNDPSDLAGGIELRKGAASVEVLKSSTGVYETNVENGDYFIYVNGKDIGRPITISGANNYVILDYYTVNFTATYVGTATGSNINATAGAKVVTSGAIVLKGTPVDITASGTGAGSYTYAWNDTANTSTATLSIPSLSNTVNVTCTVTGSGTPITDPAYEINGSGYNWTGSNETIVLSGTDDTLTILKAPTASIKINVQSAEGSTVTIDGNSVACNNTYIVVLNEITLNLNNVDVTAPSNWSGLVLNSDGDGGIMTVNVSGICSLTGTGVGCGIRSEHDQTLVIKGDGILNATGGSEVSGSDGGTGIYLIAFYTGTDLTIEGDITINAVGGSSLTHSGGDGIMAAFGDILIKSGTVNATSGESKGTNYNSSYGIGASFLASDHSRGGNLTILGGTVDAKGGYAEHLAGAYGMYIFKKLTIEGGSVTATGGNSKDASGGTGVVCNEKNIEVSGGSLNAIGGDSNSYGGAGIYDFYGDILFSGGTVTAAGGKSANSNGGIGIAVSGTGNLGISDTEVTAAGGDGGVYGAHAIYVNLGTVTVNNGSELRAVGGKGKTSGGGVGLRATGNNGTTLYGNTVTISNDAGDIFIRGGQGVTEERASIMGKDMYIGTGNIGPVVKEAGASVRNIRNKYSGDELYLVRVTLNPAKETDIQCVVNGISGGTYTYRAKTSADGTALLWLPGGEQVISASGYGNEPISVISNDTENAVTLSVLSGDASLKATSTVKGEIITSLGTPSSTIGSEAAGLVTITAAKAADTSNAGSFITLFDKNDSNASVKVVKYAAGASAADFATAAPYGNEAITGGDFFIVRVTARDSSAEYYRINVAVIPSIPGVTANDTTNRLVGADNTMEYSVDGGISWLSYNTTNEPTFTGNQLVQVRVKAVGINPAGSSKTITFTANQIPTQPPTNTNNPATTDTTKATTVTRQVDVNGANSTTSSTVAKVDIVREVKDEKSIDTVELDRSKTVDVIQKILKQNQNIVQIVIDDIPKAPADEVAVTVNTDSVKELSKNNITLEIKTAEVTVKLPAESIQELSEKDDDLYFRIVPIRDTEKKAETLQNAVTSKVVQTAAGNSEVTALGTPMTIETNYQNFATKITFSLKGIAIPTDKAQRAAFLSNLGVYINHSDGEQELNRGTIVYDKKGNPVGIEVEISKFSTFTIVNISNKAPVASKLKVSGKTVTGKVLTLSYTYTDTNKDKEGNSLIKWYRADNKSGKNKKLIAKGSKLTYKITKQDNGKYILVEVTPIAKTGNITGKTVKTSIKIPAVKEHKETENNKDTKKAPELIYKTHVKLGVFGSQTYAESVAKIFEQEYKTGNVKVLKEGKYYRVYIDFTDKTTANMACKDMISREYIINYYFY